MSRWAIQTFGLGYQHAAGVKALEDVSLNIRRGDVFVLMGPSGCGKTTLLGLAAGHLKAQAGRVELFGHDPYRHRVAASCSIGSVLETASASMQDHLTVRDLLEVTCRKYDIENKRLEEVLQVTGLIQFSHRRSGQLSPGIKRRLAIGAALLPNPGLLILDEPSKGLDLRGKAWLISVLKKLNQTQGVTILMSSQCPSEVCNLATRVGVLNRGRLVFEGTWNDMVIGRRPRLLIHTSDNVKAASLLRNYPLELTDDGLYVPYLDEYQTAMINRQLVGNQVDVYVLRPGKPDLDELIEDLTAES